MKKTKPATYSDLGRIGGMANLKKHGKKTFSNMASLSWKNGASPKRVAMQIIRASVTSALAKHRRFLEEGNKIQCSICSKMIKDSRNLASYIQDYNHPLDLMLAHKGCIKSEKGEPKMLKDHNAVRIIKAKESMPGASSIDVLIESRKRRFYK